MAKKRKRYHKAVPHKRKNNKSIKNGSKGTLQKTNEVTTLFYNSDQPLTTKEISIKLNKLHFSSKELHAILADLMADHVLQKTSKNKFCLSSHHNLVTGTIEVNPKGFGFLTAIKTNSSKQQIISLTRDAFISAGRMGTSRHGDSVLAQIIKIRKDGRPEAKIIHVLDRSSEQLAGFLVKDTTGLKVVPEDPRYPMTIHIEDENNLREHIGDCVIVKLSIGNGNTSSLKGRVIEVLGPPDSVDVQMRLVIERYRLPYQFSKKATQESEALAKSVSKEAENSSRDDLRDICHITIDSESAKDFDDAVAVEKISTGFRLYVSIADVSHFVQPGSTLDKEAYERGTSVYFPGRVIPMLPEQLSNNLCSLIPNRDRLTFSAVLDFDGQGNRTKKRFAKSIIESKNRFTYTTVKKILIDNDKETQEEHKSFLTPLNIASQLAKLLKNKREQRGSIHFTLPEPDIILDQNGTIESINRAERNFAHEMIEEFMLAANEAVAETFTKHNQQTLYRIHEHPNSEKIEEFISFAKTLDLHLPAYDDSPEWYNGALDVVKGSPLEYVVNNLLLRTMQQAKYDTDNAGHFGLAATDYCHFTSPIRRYPDLVVHRNLQQLLSTPVGKTATLKKSTNKEAATHLSNRERVAIKAERHMNDRLKLHFMKKHIGHSFDGIISGVNDFAFFVELLDLFVSGSVALSMLTDDYYIYDPTHHRVVGELGHKVFQIGDIIPVTVIDVDSHRNRINFAPEYLT